ncbi:MAG: LysR family transcriptional regulator [Micropepsaceae bacterium]
MVVKNETFDASLRDARAFCEVVDFGSISAAAKRLGESKGSVSRRISRLEASLGVRLLARTPRAVTTTEEGMAFHARAQAGLALLDEAADCARGQREIPRGNLRITCSLDLSTELLPPLIARFLTRYPQITPELIVTDTPIDLAAHRIDLALRMGIGALPDQAHTGFELATSDLRLFAAPSWIKANTRPAEPQDVNGRPIITLTRQLPAGGLPLVNADGAKASIQARVAGRASDFATLIRMAEAGIGAAYLPIIMVHRAVRAGTLIDLLPAWHFPGIKLHALTLPGRDVPARVRLFRQFLKNELAGF